MSDLHLFLYREPTDGWPSNGRPRTTLRGKLFEAELVLLPDGHALQLTADNRTVAEFVLPAAPAPGAVAEVDLTEAAAGGFFSNDRLLYRSDHRREVFDDDAAFQAACTEAEAALAAGGAEVLRDGTAGDATPIVSAVARDHEVEVRALHRDPAARTLLRWTTVLGLKLKMRR